MTFDFDFIVTQSIHFFFSLPLILHPSFQPCSIVHHILNFVFKLIKYTCSRLPTSHAITGSIAGCNYGNFNLLKRFVLPSFRNKSFYLLPPSDNQTNGDTPSLHGATVASDEALRTPPRKGIEGKRV